MKKEGTSFRGVVEHARLELALTYLGDRGLSVGDVAQLLGYGETGAFARAFKRWTGHPPGAIRRNRCL